MKTVLVVLLTFTILLTNTMVYAAEADLVISTGKKDGGYFGIGNRLDKVMTAQGMTVEVLESVGSLENLQRLNDPDSPVNLALTQTDALKHYLDSNRAFVDKFEILESIGKECVFIIAGANTGIDDDSDLQKESDNRIAILSPDSGVAVTYQYMSALEPGFRNTAVTYMDTMEALSKIKAGGDENTVKAVMLVQRPKVRSPEIQMALYHPEDYRFIAIEDADLNDKLPNGKAVYTFLNIPLMKTGLTSGLRVKTICVEGLLLVAKDKLDAEQYSRLSHSIERQWMQIYPVEQ